MERREYSLFVCRGVTCTSLFADDVYREFRRLLQKTGLAARVALERGGCYDRCGGGVTVVVRREATPDVVYPEVVETEVGRIVREHLADDRPIADLQGVRRGAKPKATPACGGA
jgi:(2Fe-2S) ferredoxin